MSDFSFTEDDLNNPLEDDAGLEDEADLQPSRVGPEASLSGRLLLRRALEMAGGFSGELTSNSTVKVLSTGSVKGAVDAFNVTVEGRVHAEMTARKRLEILKGGKFVGELQIQPEVIVVSEHAVFGRDDEIAESFHKEYSGSRSKQPPAAETPAPVEEPEIDGPDGTADPAAFDDEADDKA